MEGWLALERQVLVAIGVVIVLSTWSGQRRPSSVGALVGGAAVGAFFYIWVGGLRHIVPTEHWWAFGLDWRIHFLGWHFFRHEAWHLPPGRIDTYFVPMGTAVGFTDSIPLAAFALKPFHGVLPMPMQYLGAWMLGCFMLQGFFGARIARLFTASAAGQVLAACCFVLVPTLLMRQWHPALCAHFLLLWAIWVYLRTDRESRPFWGHVTGLGLIAGLVHPYLAVMVLALVGAIALSLGVSGTRRHVATAVGLWLLTLGVIVTGWWASGLFTVSGVANLAGEGLGKYSVNLLALVTPTGWSSLLPDVPVASEWQRFEGFQYLGAGLIALLVVAGAVWMRSERPSGSIRWWPLGLVCAALALYAVTPRVTMGAWVVADLQHDWIDRFAVFRAAGRFFWPVTYVLIAGALVVLFTRRPLRFVVPLLAAIVALQVVDLRGEYAARRHTRGDPSWYEWPGRLPSPVWHAALPHYDHLLMYPPPHCGPPPVTFEAVAYLAALYGVTINGGLVARYDVDKAVASCAALVEMLTSGDVRSDTIYLGSVAQAAAFRADVDVPLTCGVVDGVGVCVTTESYGAWRDAARLE